MVLLDLLGRRWALRLLYELALRPRSFTELQERCGVSPSVLAQRLRELESAKIVSRAGSGDYDLTQSARDLEDTLLSLNTWALAWAKYEFGYVPPRRRSKDRDQ